MEKFLILLLFLCLPTLAFCDIYSVGLGSYTDEVPDGLTPYFDNSETPEIDDPQGFPDPPDYVTENVTGVVPSGDWWTSITVEQYGAPLYALPLSVQFTAQGVEVGFPVVNENIDPIDGESEIIGVHESDITVTAEGFSPEASLLDGWSDWAVDVVMRDGLKEIKTTVAHGCPYVFFEFKEMRTIKLQFNGEIQIDPVLKSSWRHFDNAFMVKVNGKAYGIFSPLFSYWTQEGNTLTVKLPHLKVKRYLTIAALPDDNYGNYLKIASCAFNFITDTKAEYSYDPSTNKITNTFTVTVDPKPGRGLAGRGESKDDTVFALFAHQWRDNPSLNFLGPVYTTVRGHMKTVAGSSFSKERLSVNILPYLPNNGEQSINFLYDLLDEINAEADFMRDGPDPGLQIDLYWTGKNLQRLTDALPIAIQLGHTELRDRILATMKNFMEMWMRADDVMDLIYNGDFSNGLNNWALFTADWGGVFATITVPGGELYVVNTSWPGYLPWHIQVQNFPFTLVQERTYKLSFDARADAPRSVNAAVGKNHSDFATYADWNVALTTSMQSFEYTFTMTEPTDTNSRFILNCGIEDPGVYLDNVSLIELPAQFLFTYEPGWGTMLAFPANYRSDRDLNDHHFHYGYFIRAAAFVAMHDPDWALDENWGGMVKMIIKDFANWDRNDSMFPYLRTFDPYAGHSWASGLGNTNKSGFELGANQESSSESINASAAIALWGAVTGDDAIRDLGLYLYNTEVEAVQNYWFNIYKDNFPSFFEHKDIGIVFGGGSLPSTWWTEDPIQKWGINRLPVSGHSLYLGKFPQFVVDSEAALWHEYSLSGGSPPWWHDLLYEVRALVDSDRAESDWYNQYFIEEGFSPEFAESLAHEYQWIKDLGYMGAPDYSVTSDSPFSAVLNKNGAKTYVAFNAGDMTITVNFSDGMYLDVPAGELAYTPVTLPDEDDHPDTLITNGNFNSDTSGWGLFTADWEGVSAQMLPVNKELYVDITTWGGYLIWHVQVQKLGLTMENGNTYRVVFYARAEAPRTMNVALGKNHSDFAGYGEINVDLTTEMQRYEFEVFMNSPTDTNARLIFNCGASDFDVIIDRVMITETSPPEPPYHHEPGEEIIVNGDFEADLDSWVFYDNDTGNNNVAATGNYDADGDNELSIQLNQIGGANYQPHLFQDLYLVEDQAYVLTFTIWSSTNRVVQLELGGNQSSGQLSYDKIEGMNPLTGVAGDDPDALYNNQIVLSSTPLTVTREFVAVGEAGANLDFVFGAFKLAFDLGNIAGNSDDGGYIYLDDVSLIRQEPVSTP